MSYSSYFSAIHQGDYAYAIFNEWINYVQENLPPTASPLEKEYFLKKQVLTYLFPFYVFLESPFTISGMRQGVQILQKWYKQKKGKICLFADSDADGISAAALFYIFLRDILKVPESEIVFLTPGWDDKFGLGDKFSYEIIKINPAILFTFDCGSTDHESIDAIKKNQNTKVVILDHHTIHESPNVDALIHAAKSLPQSRHLSTSVLAFQFIRAFLESQIPHYNKIYEIQEGDKKIFVQDGIFLNDPGENPTTTVSWDGQSEIKLKSFWEKSVHKDSELFQIQKFLEKNPTALDTAEKFLLLQNFFRSNIKENLRFALFYAALGVVSDIVPLWTDNRIILYQTLRLIPQSENSLMPGFRELLRRLDLLKPHLKEQDFAFYLCPTINAADRMGKPELAFQALIEKDPLEGARLAHELFMLNQERKTVVKKALEILEKNPDNIIKERVVVAYHQEIHRGISGLLANKLAESYQRPAIVLVDDGESLRGSMRSYGDHDVFSFMSRVRHHFLQFGGHPNALGFSLAYEKKEIFLKEVQELSQEFFKPNLQDVKETKKRANFTFWDHELTYNLWKELLLFAPYGNGNPLPELTIINSLPVQIETFGSEKNHLRITLLANPEIELVWFFAKEKNFSQEISYEWIGEPVWENYDGKLLPTLNIRKVKPWGMK